MGTVINALRMTLGQEDSFGRVLSGATGKNAKELWKAAKTTDGSTIKNFINTTSKEVDSFEKILSHTDEVFKGVDKSVIKTIKKGGKTNNAYFQKISEFFNKTIGKSGDDVAKIAKETFGISDDVAKIVAKNSDDVAKMAAEATGKSAKGLFKSLKGKGGTLGIALTAAFELPDIVKAFKNGDGVKQIGRSALSVGGFAAGAAAGAAIGSVIPIAGTAVGGIIGGLCGLVGGMLGGSASEKIGNKIFGKSIQDQKEEAQAAQQEALAQQQIPFTTQG
ncbi:MAG: hypothetical protein PHV37_06765 [Candidatus Gastranaerophilales bacterium]|nr:hypothetical protein [Candidatus Gastranaerophilales bacterium]